MCLISYGQMSLLMMFPGILQVGCGRHIGFQQISTCSSMFPNPFTPNNGTHSRQWVMTYIVCHLQVKALQTCAISFFLFLLATLPEIHMFK